MDIVEEDTENTKETHCSICGDLLCDKFIHILECNHIFHYDCLVKSFGTYIVKDLFYIDKNRMCPYCRKPCKYLPLVNGIKRIIPGIHCHPYKVKEKRKELVNYDKKCDYVFKKGKRKEEECGKNCKLGYTTCPVHFKAGSK